MAKQDNIIIALTHEIKLKKPHRSSYHHVLHEFVKALLLTKNWTLPASKWILLFNINFTPT